MGEEKLTLKDRFSSIEPKHLVVPIILVLAFIGTLVGVINYQSKNKTQVAPKIQISTPDEGANVENSQIVIEGKTSTDATVKVNSNKIKVDSKGNFKAEVPLNAGENKIAIAATNKNGKETLVIRKVTRTIKPETVSAPVTAANQPNQPSAGPSTAATPDQIGQAGDLSTSGPESFWIPEAGLFAVAGAAWYGSRRKFKKIIQKS